MSYVSTPTMVKQVKAGNTSSLLPMIAEKARATWHKLPTYERANTSVQDLISEGQQHLIEKILPGFKLSLGNKFSTFAYASLDNFYIDKLRAAYANKRLVSMLSIDSDVIKGVSLDKRIKAYCRYERTEDAIIMRIDAERAFLRAYVVGSKVLRRYMIRWLLQPNADGRVKPGDKQSEAVTEFTEVAVPIITLELCDFIQTDYECRCSISSKLVLSFSTTKRKTQPKTLYNSEEFCLLPALDSEALGEVIIG